VLSRDRLLTLTRNREWEPFDRSIDIRIARLRRKVEIDPDNPMAIRTCAARATCSCRRSADAAARTSSRLSVTVGIAVFQLCNSAGLPGDGLLHSAARSRHFTLRRHATGHCFRVD
jgi:hypothetical protein